MARASTSTARTEVGSLTKVAYDRIKADIMQHRMRPGECLSGCQLAKKLNMSRTPVREALNLLANEGFVEIQNGVGIHIKEITKKDILELIEVRVTLECAALESSTFGVNLNALEELEEGWLKLEREFQSGQLDDLDKVMNLDYQTHDFIVASSNNSYLVEVIQNVSDRFRQVQYLSVKALNDVEDTISQHLELLDGLKKGRLSDVMRQLREHILEAETYIFTDTPAKKTKTIRRPSAAKEV
ncbi:hypothetical protein C4J81_08920 [Deltaproteobacteria bacterium Smac51]|nr:hypothetical protein C4J81_08920 [Deltaproteobacteria bacterium Smac51]